MSSDLHAHGARELVTDEYVADNQCYPDAPAALEEAEAEAEVAAAEDAAPDAEAAPAEAASAEDSPAAQPAARLGGLAPGEDEAPRRGPPPRLPRARGRVLPPQL